MAIFYPTLEEIAAQKVKPEEGEWRLLTFLRDHLDDRYEVYFNPFLNGDRPDIIIMRKDYGVMIIEVKDWRFDSYLLDEKKHWKLRVNEAIVKSPVKQVIQYKENMYNLHIEDLLEMRIKNYRYWNVISCAVYFHKESNQSISDFLIKPYKQDHKYLDFLKKGLDFIGNDDLNSDFFSKLFKSRYMEADRPSLLFDEKLYRSFKRYLQPPFHHSHEGQNTRYSKRQQELIISSAGDRRIKGVVGSGKTTVLAARAVSAHKRTGGQVLILTYNITLKNYLHDKISKVREDFSWGAFHINNYHNFITSELNNLGVPFRIPKGFEEWSNKERSDYFEREYYSNIDLFRSRMDDLRKYEVILVDEIQDYRRPWMDILKECFLLPGGEYVLFGDEKQNIYSNEITNKDLNTNVRGRPTEMKECFRSDKRILNLATQFQSKYFDGKYDLDDLSASGQLTLSFEKPPRLQYIYTPIEDDVEFLYHTIREISLELNAHPNDVTVLGYTISLLRNFDAYYRYRSNEKTNVMFETEEVWNKLILNGHYKNDLVKEGICLMAGIRDRDRCEVILSKALTLSGLLDRYKERLFEQPLREHLDSYSIDYAQYTHWRDAWLKFESSKAAHLAGLSKRVKDVRDNKKIHFWYNRGTTKISTIHSFKGWEANTLFLIVEPKYDEGEFKLSFDELIYTGLTRSRYHLVIINMGNHVYDSDLRELVELSKKIQ
jgi:hypothetical protein